MPDEEQPSFAEFDFDLARAVLEQLVEAFHRLPVGQLISTNLIPMPDGQGVYQLFENNELRYVGKADDLRGRLMRHEKALSARVGIEFETIRFKALYIHKNWTTWTTETAMIAHFGESMLPWNASGYGSNDPGRKRDHTSEAGTFNERHPINLDVPCIGIEAGEFSAFDALIALSRKLPYTLRFERVTTQARGASAREAEEELRATRVTVPEGPMSVRDAFLGIVRQLPSGWQATALRGRLLLYREDAEYDHGDVLLRT
jgi:hypothetical protein